MPRIAQSHTAFQVECEKCGKGYTKKGISAHLRACKGQLNATWLAPLTPIPASPPTSPAPMNQLVDVSGLEGLEDMVQHLSFEDLQFEPPPPILSPTPEDGQVSDSDESEFQSAQSSDGEDDTLTPVPIQPGPRTQDYCHRYPTTCSSSYPHNTTRVPHLQRDSTHPRNL